MQYIGKRDSLDKARQGVSVAELEKRYRTANETALREAGLRYRAWIATLACLLLAAAVTGAVVGYRRKLRHRDAQLSEYLTLLESYRESHDSLTSRLDASNEREAAVKASLEGRFALLRDIAATYYTYGEGERLARKVKELALSPAMLADIVRMADLYNDRAVTRLRRQLPGCTRSNRNSNAGSPNRGLRTGSFSPVFSHSKGARRAGKNLRDRTLCKSTFYTQTSKNYSVPASRIGA